MNVTAISRESPRFEAIALVNGRAKSDVLLRLRLTKDVIHSDEINPTSSPQRDAFVQRLSEEDRDEAAGLLIDLAESVAAQRAKPKSEDAKNADPFPVVEPWEGEVNGAAVLDEVRQVLERYIVLPPHAADVIALWIAHTHVFDRGDYTPYLLVTSPTRECGKSTLLDLLGVLAHRPQLTGGISAAALYRRIARLRPTILMDELDTQLRTERGEALRGVLNTGFHSSGKHTICVGDDHEDKDFPTYCPKVLAGIGRLWDTVTSRSIPVRLKRASKPELVGLDRIRGDRIGAALLPLRRRMVRWTSDVAGRLNVTDTVTPDELGARQSDVWRPLLALADLAGGRWPSDARTAACVLHGVAEEEGDYGLLLLQDIQVLFKSIGEDEISSAYIVDQLSQREDRPWPEYKGGKPITPRGIASLLGRFEVKPKTIRFRGELAKGYTLDALHPVFATYLTTSPQSVTSVTGSPVAPAGVGVTDVTDRTDGVGADESGEDLL